MSEVTPEPGWVQRFRALLRIRREVEAVEPVGGSPSTMLVPAAAVEESLAWFDAEARRPVVKREGRS